MHCLGPAAWGLGATRRCEAAGPARSACCWLRSRKVVVTRSWHPDAPKAAFPSPTQPTLSHIRFPFPPKHTHSVCNTHTHTHVGSPLLPHPTASSRWRRWSRCRSAMLTRSGAWMRRPTTPTTRGATRCWLWPRPRSWTIGSGSLPCGGRSGGSAGGMRVCHVGNVQVGTFSCGRGHRPKWTTAPRRCLAHAAA